MDANKRKSHLMGESLVNTHTPVAGHVSNWGGGRGETLRGIQKKTDQHRKDNLVSS